MKERVQCTFLFYSLELCQGQQQHGYGAFPSANFTQEMHFTRLEDDYKYQKLRKIVKKHQR